MHTETYTANSEGDPEVFARDEAMENAMPSAVDIYEKFQAQKARVKPTTLNQLNVDFRCLQAARNVWQVTRNPYIAINDVSHPNNWTSHTLLKMAGVIQNAMGIPLYDKK